MSFLTNIKERLFRKRMEEETSRPPAEQPGEKVSLVNSKQITILFVADSAEDRKTVDKWRDANQRSGTKIKVIGFLEQEVGSASFDFESIQQHSRAYASLLAGSLADDISQREKNKINKRQVHPPPLLKIHQIT